MSSENLEPVSVNLSDQARDQHALLQSQLPVALSGEDISDERPQMFVIDMSSADHSYVPGNVPVPKVTYEDKILISNDGQSTNSLRYIKSNNQQPVALTVVGDDNRRNEKRNISIEEIEGEIIKIITEGGQATQCSMTEHSYSQSNTDDGEPGELQLVEEQVITNNGEIIMDGTVGSSVIYVTDSSEIIEVAREVEKSVSPKAKQIEHGTNNIKNTEQGLSQNMDELSEGIGIENVMKKSRKKPKNEQRIYKVYRCGKCSKSFYDTDSYLDHLKDHADQESFECLICQKKIVSMFKLKRHMMLHDSQYKCDVCGKMFLKEKNLVMHKNLHNKKMFNCSKCEKKFFRPGDLKNHMIVHQTGKRYKCEECDLVFPKYDSYLWHKNGHNKDEIMKCETCGDIITSLNCLRHHLKLHKKEQKETEENEENWEAEDLSYMCQYCSEVFTKYKEFTKHVDSHGEADAYECKNCDKKFSSHASLYKHKLRCENTDKFPCSVCEKVFKYQRTLDIHMNSHSGILFKCEEEGCTKEFKTKQGLFIHMKIHAGTAHLCNICGKMSTSRTNHEEHVMIHTGEKPHVCSQCGKGFIQKRKLKEHMYTHSGKSRPKEKLFMCTICDHAYSSKKALIEHTRDHTGDMPYVCNICGAKFSRQTGYRNHMNRHEDKRNYRCKECGKGFNYNSNLKAHMVVHSGVKPFKCDICPKSYTRAAELRHHHAAVHEGKNLNKFFCKYCNKGFSHVTNLKHHVYTHTGEKPYKCDHCEAAFTTNQSLKFHKQKVHGLKEPDSAHKMGKYRDHVNLEKGMQCNFSDDEEQDMQEIQEVQEYEEVIDEELQTATVKVQQMNDENVIYLNISDLDDAESFIAIIEAPVEVQTS